MLTVVIFNFLFVCSCEKGAQKAETLDFDRIPVKTIQVSAEKIDEKHQYLGIIVESQSIPLSFPCLGTVKQVMVYEGQKIVKGQLLVSLMDENAKSILMAAKAKEKQAHDAYERLAKVYKQGSLPEIKFVEIETGLQQAKSAAQVAEKNFRDCMLYAPSSGVLGKRSIEPGVNVVPNIPIMTIVKIDSVYAKISIPESKIADISVDQKVIVQIEALLNIKKEGKVCEKSIIADPITRTYVIKIKIDNSDNRLLPGMTCMAEISDSPTEPRITIPLYAILNGEDGKYVFVANPTDKKAIRRHVEIGTFRNNRVEILSGINEGEYVIVEGYQKLSDNTSVAIK